MSIPAQAQNPQGRGEFDPGSVSECVAILNVMAAACNSYPMTIPELVQLVNAGKRGMMSLQGLDSQYSDELSQGIAYFLIGSYEEICKTYPTLPALSANGVCALPEKVAYH